MNSTLDEIMQSRVLRYITPKRYKIRKENIT